MPHLPRLIERIRITLLPVVVGLLAEGLSLLIAGLADRLSPAARLGQ